MIKRALFLFRWHHVYWLKKALKGMEGKLLDIGSGKGKIVRKALETRDDLRLVTMDVERKKGWRIDVVADARKLPMKKGEFDGVLILDVLEHVKGPEKVLQEARRVLKQGGVIHVTVPLEEGWWTVDWWLRRLGMDYKEKVMGHINQFDLKTIRRLMKKAGFRIEWMRYSCHWLYQLGAAGYSWYLARKPKQELKPKGGFWLPLPGWVRLGVVLLGWLTVLESGVLARVPGGEVHITAKKV